MIGGLSAACGKQQDFLGDHIDDCGGRIGNRNPHAGELLSITDSSGCSSRPDDRSARREGTNIRFVGRINRSIMLPQQGKHTSPHRHAAGSRSAAAGSPETICASPIALPGRPPDIIAAIGPGSRRTAAGPPPGSDEEAGNGIRNQQMRRLVFCPVTHSSVCAAWRSPTPACRGACAVYSGAGAAGLRDEPAGRRQPAATADPAELSHRLAAGAARTGGAKPVGAEPRAARRDAPAQ